MDYYNIDIKEAIKQKKTSLNGLTDIEAKNRLLIFGENKLKETKRFQTLKIFFSQFHDPLIYILIAAVVISFIAKEFIDAYVITAILVLNAILGFIQEFKAEKSIELLKRLTALKTKVIRNGIIKQVPSLELVSGDIVLVEAGDKIPADLRLFEVNELKIDEASLTGESVPIKKTIEILKGKIELADQRNMLFSGTLVASGSGKGIVVETGMNTQLGRIATLVQGVEDIETPLQKKLKQLGKYLIVFTLIICAIIFLIGISSNVPIFEMLITAIALAVAVVPEGLPAVVTISLALSVKKLVKKNALIKKLKAVETLGSTTLIASDKTGTLTKNEMTVSKIFVNHALIDVTGSGYNDKGTFLYNNKKVDPSRFKLLLEIAASCNNATEEFGDPTEMALLFAAKKGKISRIERKGEIPFDSDKKYMATIHKGVSYYKGAPEIILKMCSHLNLDGRERFITRTERDKIIQVNEDMAKQALRVLAMAYEKDNKFVFVGLMGMIDPPREEVKESIQLCKAAGIKQVMITGDHPLTAKAIADQVGITGLVMAGAELDKLSDEQLRLAVKKYSIFARTTSEHKLRILTALQRNGEIVAMTGDGVNDAPAVKKADIGVAMAIKGTDVTRDAADMVLTDDNFASIVSAVRHGRVVYDNIKRFIKFLLGANLSEILLILLALIFSLPLPLLALQILWLNLVTDSLPALALGTTQSEEDVMKRKPRNPKESIFKDMKGFIITAGIIGAVVTLLIFLYAMNDLSKARTLALTTIILFELFIAFSCESNKPFKKIFSNKYLNLAVLASIILQVIVIYTPLRSAFKLVPLTFLDWITVLVLASIGFLIIEIKKLLDQRAVNLYHSSA